MSLTGTAIEQTGQKHGGLRRKDRTYFRPTLSVMYIASKTAQMMMTELIVLKTKGSMAPISFTNTAPYFEVKLCPVACKKKLVPIQTRVRLRLFPCHISLKEPFSTFIFIEATNVWNSASISSSENRPRRRSSRFARASSGRLRNRSQRGD